MFLPENIDLANPENYNLIIRLKTHGFAFLIQDIEDKENYSYQETLFSNETSLLSNIQRIIFDLTFLTENFNKVKVIVVSENFEIMPIEFYDKNTIKELYGLTHINDSIQILENDTNKNRYKVIFELDCEVYSFLKRNLFNPDFYHYNSLSLNFFISKISEKNKQSYMFISFHEGITDIICINKDKQVSHIHNYLNESDENMVYYVLNTWKHLGYDQLTDKLYFYNLHSNNKIESELKLYIKNIENLEFDEKRIPVDILSILE